MGWYQTDEQEWKYVEEKPGMMKWAVAIAAVLAVVAAAAGAVLLHRKRKT